MFSLFSTILACFLYFTALGHLLVHFIGFSYPKMQHFNSCLIWLLPIFQSRNEPKGKREFNSFYFPILSRNVIDVAALDSHNLEQHEYVERARQYIQKAQAAQPVLLSKYNRLIVAKNTGWSGSFFIYVKKPT